MKRKWDNFINKNKYSECQLITALNAYYYLTGKHIKQDSVRYEEFVDLVNARHGAAIKIKRIWDILGLTVLQESNSLFELEVRYKGIPLPLEYGINNMVFILL